MEGISRNNMHPSQCRNGAGTSKKKHGSYEDICRNRVEEINEVTILPVTDMDNLNDRVSSWSLNVNSDLSRKIRVV